MKAARLLILVLTLLALAAVPGAAAPSAGPCAPGTAYDPACDVNHDNQMTIADIQLTAGHWNQTGTWVSDNQHTHLGQTWTGTNNALSLTGYYGDPENAPLVLSNSGSFGLRVDSAGHAGVSVGSSDYGLIVDAATYNGVFVDAAGHEGVYVDTAGYDGVRVYAAGNPTNSHSSTSYNGFEIQGAQGMGVFIGHAGEDGVRIQSAADDGIQIGHAGSTPYYGVYVPAPGTPGTTLLPDTSAFNGEWALYTDDRIHAATLVAGAQALVAVVGGDQPLGAGDAVAATGLGNPLPEGDSQWVEVRLASAEQANVVGVVSSRMALQPLPGKDGKQELRSVAGPAQPGDFVAITVLGIASVKVDSAAPIASGQRLTVAETPGHVRALRALRVQDANVDESGPILGVALEAAKEGMIWVLVNPQ